MTRAWLARCARSVALGALLAGPAVAETPQERGAYIVNVLAACAGCHTPRTSSGLGSALSGGNRFGPPEARVAAPNITPDPATGIGRWSDRQIVDAIKLGVRPDGTRIGPPMPQTAYGAMTDADAEAIVTYLRSVPPIIHAVGAPAHATPPTIVEKHLRPLASDGDAVARGRYIANALSHCTECHTPVPLTSHEAAERLDTGGRLFKTPKGAIVAPGIRSTDLTRFSDAALALVVTRGVKPNGARIEGPMPVRSYAGFKEADLEALIAFLRSAQTGPAL